MLHFDQIVIGSGGLPVCVRSTEPEAPTFRPAVEILRDMDAVAQLSRSGPGLSISLVGTEAFLHPQLPELVQGAREAGAVRIGISTGGGALAQQDNAAGCIRAGVRHVDLVLLAGEGKHDALTGVEGSYAAALEGAATLHREAERAGVHVALMGHVPVCRHNVHELPMAIAAFVEMRAVAVHLAPHADLDVPKNIEWFGSAFQTGIMHGVWVCAEPADIEIFGRWALHVGDPCHVGASR